MALAAALREVAEAVRAAEQQATVGQSAARQWAAPVALESGRAWEPEADVRAHR